MHPVPHRPRSRQPAIVRENGVIAPPATLCAMGRRMSKALERPGHAPGSAHGAPGQPIVWAGVRHKNGVIAPPVTLRAMGRRMFKALGRPVHAPGGSPWRPRPAPRGHGLAESHLPPIIGYFAKTRFSQVDAFFLRRHKSKIWT